MERLPKSIGWGMGLEFRESQLQLTAPECGRRAARHGLQRDAGVRSTSLLCSAVRVCICSLQRARACDFA